MTKSTSRLHEVNLFEKAASLLRRRDSNSAHLLASYPRQTSTPGDLKTELTPFHEPPSFWPGDSHLSQRSCTCARHLASHFPSQLAWYLQTTEKFAGSLLPRQAEGQASPLRIQATCPNGPRKLGHSRAVVLDKERSTWKSCKVGMGVCREQHTPRIFSSNKSPR